MISNRNIAYKITINFLILFFKTILFSNQEYSQYFVTRIPTQEKIVFLTFDDGPGPWTKEVLEILNKHNIKSTFFVLGELVKYRKDLLKQIYSQGHEIGIHCYEHKNFYQLQKKQSLNEVKQELIFQIEQSIKEVYDSIGIKPRYLRMPYGYYRSWMDEYLKKYNLTVINWCFGFDWQNITSAEMADKYCKNLQPGGIYLFHDGGQNRKKTVESLKIFIEYAIKNNYKFGNLKEFIK